MCVAGGSDRERERESWQSIIRERERERSSTRTHQTGCCGCSERKRTTKSDGRFRWGIYPQRSLYPPCFPPLLFECRCRRRRRRRKRAAAQNRDSSSNQNHPDRLEGVGANETDEGEKKGRPQGAPRMNFFSFFPFFFFLFFFFPLFFLFSYSYPVQ